MLFPVLKSMIFFFQVTSLKCIFSDLFFHSPACVCVCARVRAHTHTHSYFLKTQSLLLCHWLSSFNSMEVMDFLLHQQYISASLFLIAAWYSTMIGQCFPSSVPEMIFRCQDTDPLRVLGRTGNLQK